MAQAADAVWLSVLPDMSGFGKGIIKSAGKETDKAGKTMGQRIGRGITLGVAAVGAGAAAVGTALYNIGKSFDEMRDIIAVSTGAAGEDLDALVESAKNVGRQVPADFNTIGDALATLNTLTGATGDSLEDMTGSVVEASRLLGEDASANAEKFGKVMTQWQIPAEQGAEKLDTLFVATQNYGVSLQGIMGHLNSYGPILQNAGFEMEEAIGFFSQLEAGGISVSRVMPALNASFRNWAAEGKNSKEELQNVVEEIKNTEDAQEALALASDVFGAQGAQRLTTAIRNGTLELEDLTGALEDSEGAIGSASEETMSFGEHWELFKNNILVELEPLARSLFDTISDGMSFVTNTILPEFMAGWNGEDGPESTFSRLGETVRGVTDFFRENWQVIAGLTGALVAAKAAMVAYNAIMRAVQVTKTIITAVTKGWTAAQRVLNLVLRNNPIGWIITILGLLVAAFKLAWDNSETFRNVVTGAWEGIKSAAEAVWDWLSDAFEWIKDGLSSVGQWFTDRGQDIQNAWNAVKEGLEAGWNFIKQWIFDPIIAYYTTLWNAAVAAKDFIVDAWNAVKNGLKAGWDFIKRWVFDAFRNAVRAVWNFFRDRGRDIRGAWDTTKNALKAGFDFIKRWTFDAFVEGIRVVWNFFSDRVSDIRGAWDGLKGAFKAVWDWIDRNVFQRFRDGLDTLGGWVESAAGNISELWEGVKSAFATPINWVIRNAWNDGLLRAINAVARVIPGVSEISPLPEIRTRAKGGYTPPGWTLVGEEGPELVNFTHPSRVYTAKETQAMLAGQAPNPMVGQFTPSNPPHGGVGGWFSDRWEDVKSAGRWVADGVRDAAGNVVKWARGGLAKAAEIVLDPIRSLIQNTVGRGGGFLGDLLSGVGTFAIDKLLDWLREEDEGAAPDAGGRQLRGAQPHVNNAAWALADAVGGIRTMQAFNQSMAGGHPKGLAVDFIDSVSKLNRLADLISGGMHFDNFNYMAWQARLWSPGRGWRPQGRGFGNDPMHRWHLHAEWYDDGGWMTPGVGMYANMTRQPEAVLTGPQWATLATLASRAYSMPEVMYLRDYDGELVARMRVEARNEIEAEVEPLQREQRQQIGV